MSLVLLQKVFAYGCIGVLIEFFFTAFGGLVSKKWKLAGTSYLWMIGVYGGTALVLESVGQALPWSPWLKAFVYVPIIYGSEALTGWIVQKITWLLQTFFGGTEGGTIPWEYSKSKWTPMGLVNLRYAPFWLFLGFLFDPISNFLHTVILVFSKGYK